METEAEPVAESRPPPETELHPAEEPAGVPPVAPSRLRFWRRPAAGGEPAAAEPVVAPEDVPSEWEGEQRAAAAAGVEEGDRAPTADAEAFPAPAEEAEPEIAVAGDGEPSPRLRLRRGRR